MFWWTRVSFFLACSILSRNTALAVSLPTLRPAIVKIEVTSNAPSIPQPWKRLPSFMASGTGFYIGDGRILTNAHVVANASFITVQRDGDPRPSPAFVRFIAHDADLAMLEALDKHLFEGVKPLELGHVPKLRSPVSTIGFPTGGDQISITDGIVSRISYRRYIHPGNTDHLLVQVDSAINPGNSGGPVIQGRAVVGVAFQSMTQAENTGYIIPTPVILRFLKDVEDGNYDGHPSHGLEVMDWALTNPATVAFHGLTPGSGGVKIAHVAAWAPTAGLIIPGDILLAIDGQEIGVDSRIDFQGERVDFRTVFDLKQLRETAVFKLSRGGLLRDVAVPIKQDAPHPKAENIYARHPKYLVYGGLVFMNLSRSLIRSWGEKWYKEAPLLLRYLDQYASFDPAFDGFADIVVLTKRLPDPVNAYATDNIFGVITSVDDHPVTSLESLADLLEKGAQEFAVIRFHGSEDPLILSRAKVRQSKEDILRKYGVHPNAWFHGSEIDGASTREDLQ
jgi:S1-C subfamily serine protease